MGWSTHSFLYCVTILYRGLIFFFNKIDMLVQSLVQMQLYLYKGPYDGRPYIISSMVLAILIAAPL